MTELAARQITVEIGGARLVDGASLHIKAGEMAALLGPNGAGKTSLVQACLGLRARTAGTVHIDDKDIDALGPMERARAVGYLPQIRPLAWPNRVRDVVALGRFSHGAAMGQLQPRDAKAVDRAIENCGLTPLASRQMDQLSGGETARVHCARVFCAETPLMVADEPTASLDPRHQFRVLDLILEYARSGGGALVVLHDVRMAALYATRLLWMKDGRILADGSPDSTLSGEMLEEVYGVKGRVVNGQVELDGAL